MLIRSLRLKNIKCYGEGPAGNGVTVHFQPGINRIAGQNGHGKSTLIESLGYALFLTEPVFEENFNAVTYLLRSGTKAGEIDVTFEYDRQTYRLERGLGPQNKRRSKIILAEDQSIAAEGDAEVSAFLWRLFGFSGPARLSELFSKLIGIKQGRLTWPFDSKSAHARQHFEPLLDVEIFRECFEKLKPAVDQFEETKREQEKSLAVAQERIQQRQASPTRLEAARRAVASLDQELTAARQARVVADQQRLLHEAKEKAFLDARAALEEAKNLQRLTRQTREHDQQRFEESDRARAIVAAQQPAHEAHTNAEAALARLQEQQTEKSRLEQERSKLSNHETECKSNARNARRQADASTEQERVKRHAAGQLQLKLEAEEKALAGSKTAFTQLAEHTRVARQARELLTHWLDDLREAISGNEQRVARSLADWSELEQWDARRLTSARAVEADAARLVQEIESALAAARQLQKTLSSQLKEIAGGMCPFLKEQCRQFDSQKVQADISDQQKAIQDLTGRLAAAKTAHQLAQENRAKLEREEARLSQVRRHLAGEVEQIVAGHNRLFPEPTQQALRVTHEYHRAQLGGAPASSLQPLAAVQAASCFDLGAGTLHAPAVQELLTAEKAFHGQAGELLHPLFQALADKFENVDRQRDERLARERDLDNQRQNLRTLEAEAATFAAKSRELLEQAVRWDGEASQAATRIAALDAALQPFAQLEQQQREQQAVKAQNTPGHQQYLGAKPTADLLPARQAALAKSAEAEAAASRQLQEKQELFGRTERDFEPTALQDARRKCEAACAQLAATTTRLETARQTLADEQKRFEEWEAACRDQERLALEIGRLQAAIELAQKARQLLQKAAPRVARHLCQRIAARAQQIYNQISHDPVELAWDSDRYSLRINPGERRFAMLSGGEQTKLALAMTLAMIREFSGLKFCVFDEPTYGVDSPSRQKLADAILEVQKAASFDQLILVSHDDAFDGKIEHVVLLKKATPLETTVTVASSPGG